MPPEGTELPVGQTEWNKTADITNFDAGHVILLTGYDTGNGYYLTYSLRENV